MMISSPLLSKALQKLNELAAQAIVVKDTPGLSVAVFDKDHVHFKKGYGLRRPEYSEPMTTSTLFQMASVSKPIFATAFAILQKKGMCSFEDHPQRYVKTLLQGETYKDVKIKHMLSHSSGISYEGFEEMIEAYIPRTQILDKLAETRPSYLPGQNFEYNNVVYGVIEDVIAALVNKPIEVVMKERLFDPLLMKNASLGLPALLESSDRFYPYMEGDDGNLVPASHYSHSYYIFPASAGVNACVEDLIPFIQLYLGKFPELMTQDDLFPLISPTIDAQKSLEFLGMPREPLKEAWYGLGWLMLNIGQEKIVYHTGYLNGVRNFVGFMPDHGIGVVLLSNTERKVASRIGLEFFYQYLGM